MPRHSEYGKPGDKITIKNGLLAYRQADNPLIEGMEPVLISGNCVRVLDAAVAKVYGGGENQNGWRYIRRSPSIWGLVAAGETLAAFREFWSG
jgi:hypothetical protein